MCSARAQNTPPPLSAVRKSDELSPIVSGVLLKGLELKKLLLASLATAMLLGSAACSAGTSTLPVTTKVASTSATASSDQLKSPDTGHCTMPQGTRSAKDTCKQCPNGTYADVCAPVQAPPSINPVTCAFYCGGDGNPSGTICPKGTQYDPDSDSCVRRVAINKKAAFGDQCSKDAEFVGHPVPPYSDDAHGITQEYPIGATNGTGAAVLVGYVYTTVGGEAYFEPVSGSVGIGVVTIGTDASLDVGPNSFVKGIATLGSTVSQKISSVLKNVGSPHFALPGPTGGACFKGGDWNGTIPS